jgi:pimeloyl-ACP methyl ester carboxylesterase
VSNDAKLKSTLQDRDGVKLAHVEAGPQNAAEPPLVLIHGWIGDHGAMLPQILHFAETRRVVAIHLRGHGDSDSPVQDYTMAGFADDIAWQCGRLGLNKPVVVGHSLGGPIALELAGRYPDLPSGIVLVDSIIFPPPSFVSQMLQNIESFSRPDYLVEARVGAAKAFLDHVDIDDPDRKQRLLDQVFEAHDKAPQHVAVSTIHHVLDGYDSWPAAKACKVPVLYLDAGVPANEAARDLERFRAACPQLVVAKTYGAGHFSPLEIPEQVNAMIERFIAVGIDRAGLGRVTAPSIQPEQRRAAMSSTSARRTHS